MGYDDDYYSGMAEIAAEHHQEEIEREERDGYYIVLLGYEGECEVLVNYPHKTKEEAVEAVKTFKGKAKQAHIYKGKPAGFE